MNFGKLDWYSIGLLVFAVLFLVLGISRVVEFQGIKKGRKRLFLTALHVIGCLLFAAALGFSAFDPGKHHTTLIYTLFVAAMAALAPGQFSIGMARRRHFEERQRD